MAAGSEIQSWRAAPGRRRWLATALAAFVVVDLSVYVHQCLPVAFSTPPEHRHVPGPAVPGVVSLRKWEFGNVPEGFEATRRGYGVIEGFQPLLGYARERPTARLYVGHPDYLGEFVSDGRPITPDAWSPNRILFRLRPFQAVEINQNPGSYWHANGRELFPGWRCVELERRFVAYADGRGTLLLEAHPPRSALRLAAGLTALGVLLAAGCARSVARSRAGVGPS